MKGVSYIVEFLIAYRITQCDVERSGNWFTRIFNKSRANLAADTLEHLIVLQNTLPVINQLDTDILIKAWQQDNRQLPSNRRSSNTPSNVLQRIKASGKSQCILVQGEQSLRPAQ